MLAPGANMLASETGSLVHRRRAQQLKQDAIISMGKHLCQYPPDQSLDAITLVSIANLSIAEWCANGDTAALVVHRRVLKSMERLIEMTKGISSLLPYDIWYWDVLASAEAGFHSLSLPASCHVKTLPPARLAQVCMYLLLPNHTVLRTEILLYSTFHEASNQGCFSLETQKLIRNDLTPWRYMAIYCFSVSDCSIADADWMGTTAVMILYKLLLIHQNTTLDRPNCPLERVFSITLIMILTQICSPFSWRTAAKNVVKLKSAIEALEAAMVATPSTLADHEDNHTAFVPTNIQECCATLTSTEARLLLWTILVGLAVATTLHDYEWFISRAATLAVRCGAVGQKDIDDVMQSNFPVQYPYVDDLMARIRQQMTLIEGRLTPLRTPTLELIASRKEMICAFDLRKRGCKDEGVYGCQEQKG